jgi:hypothetical protein
MADNRSILEDQDAVENLKGSGVGRTASRKSINVLEFIKGVSEFDRDMAETMELEFRNAIGSMDVLQHRLVSLAPGQALLRNEETAFSNIIKRNGIVQATDLTLRIRERRVGAGDAEFFSMTSLPGGRNSSRPFRTAQLGFCGNMIDVGYLPQELASQSPVEGVDVVQEEIADEIVVLDRFINKKALSNTEVTAEMAPTGTQPGGFINRSILYNTTTTGDLTGPLIQGKIDQLANNGSNEGLGYGRPIVALCREGQIGKVRDLMIARFPGETSTSYAQSMQGYMAQLEAAGVPRDAMAIYKPDPGRPVVFILESQLPSGHCLFFDPKNVRFAKMKMFGQYGYWVLQRPTSALTDLMLVFDCFGVSDPLVESRAVIKGLND